MKSLNSNSFSGAIQLSEWVWFVKVRTKFRFELKLWAGGLVQYHLAILTNAECYFQNKIMFLERENFRSDG